MLPPSEAVGFDAWEAFPAHLLLLEQFLMPRQLDAPADGRGWVHHFDPSRWQKLLGEPPDVAIERFRAGALLRPLTVEEALDCRYNVSGLKELARARAIPMSGRKSDLIQRLLDRDRAGMNTLAHASALLRCSAAGEALVERMRAVRLAERQAALSEVWRRLEARDFHEAGRIVAEYEQRQVEPRGLGMNWRRYPGDRDLEILKLIFERTPRLLASLPGATLAALRPHAAMMLLWGMGDLAECGHNGLEHTLHLEPSAAARMLLFHASSLQTLADYRALRVRRVTLCAVGDADTCDACASRDGKTFAIEHAPELPLELCTCQDGCRCHFRRADSI